MLQSSSFPSDASARTIKLRTYWNSGLEILENTNKYLNYYFFLPTKDSAAFPPPNFLWKGLSCLQNQNNVPFGDSQL